MKKFLKVFIAVLVICLSASAFIACGNEDTGAEGKTVEQVTSLFEDAGYTVSSKTLSGVSALIAIKGTDAITVLFYGSEKLATESKSSWDEAAQTASFICKQDKSNIYYGTSAAMAVYEGKGGNTPDPSEKGKTLDAVKNIFQNASYTTSAQTVAGVSALTAAKGSAAAIKLFESLSSRSQANT